LTYATLQPTEQQRPAVFDHELAPFFKELARFPSTKALEASELYRTLRPEIERVLGGLAQEDFSDRATRGRASLPASSGPALRATAWNIERGTRLPGIIRVLDKHPVIGDSDVLLLTELDYGMARSGNLFVAREIAAALGLHYVFAPCYLALTKGSGVEAYIEGENSLALHGNAILSRFPLHRAHSVALPNGKDKMSGVEKRLGCQRAVVADMEHPSGMLRVVSLHLDAHSTQAHRHGQMKLMLDHLDGLEPRLPVLIGGDWNTTTYNSSRALYSILGFWRRVMMGPGYFIKHHYPHPDRWFERHLFRELERRGWTYRDLNEPGGCTLHYDVRDMAVNRNMADWVPKWCFWFLYKALEKQEGRASLKLDWFAGKGVAVASGSEPKVFGGLRDEAGPLSDHDPIVVDIVPVKKDQRPTVHP
jgi:endonuclease/exonuclease/phosphatase family metal-dependent hydrolase